MYISHRLKSLIFSALTGGFVSIASAAPVTFWFTGKIDYIYSESNTMPAGIVIGTPFSGRITYDVTPASYQAGFTNASGSRSNIYFTTLTTASTLLQVGAHTITNVIAIPDNQTGSLHINDNYDNEDYFTFYTGQSGLIVDGALMTNSLWSIYLKDGAKTAYSSATFPVNPPSLTAFPTRQEFRWGQYDDTQQNLFSIVGTIASISTNELVALNLHRTGPNTAQVTWPVGVSGFKLQSSTNLATGAWQDVPTPILDVGMEHTVSVATGGTPRFYRLKR